MHRGYLGQAVWILTSLTPQGRCAQNTIVRALAYAYWMGGLGADTRHQAPTQLPRATLVAGIPVGFNTLAGDNQ